MTKPEKTALLRLLRRAEDSLLDREVNEFALEDTPENRELVEDLYSTLHCNNRRAEPDEDGLLWVIDWMLVHHLANKLENEIEH